MNNDKIGKIIVLTATAVFDVAGIVAAYYWKGTEFAVLAASMLGTLSAAVVGVVKLWYNLDTAVKTLLTK